MARQFFTPNFPFKITGQGPLHGLRRRSSKADRPGEPEHTAHTAHTHHPCVGSRQRQRPVSNHPYILIHELLTEITKNLPFSVSAFLE